ncbi:MAG: hypothetical protein CFE32_22070, partial [Alphaproteobacteria bacterium PA3]
EDAIAEAERLGLPDTIMVRTGKGRHIYFRHPGGKIANRAGFLPGMDIRGDGGYIVGPGSIHPSGASYTWETPPGQITLAEMPDWLVKALGAEPAAKVAPHKVRQTSRASSKIHEQSKTDLDPVGIEPATDWPGFSTNCWVSPQTRPPENGDTGARAAYRSGLTVPNPGNGMITKLVAAAAWLPSLRISWAATMPVPGIGWRTA